jgi:hydroxyacylglutathione hydrolase
MKKVLVILGAVVAILIIFAAGYFMVMKSVLNKMTPMETGRITDNIFAIKNSYVNAFVIGSDSGYVMIDAGNDPKTIQSALSKLNIDPDKVKAIFLTHSDADHVGAITLFPGADVYLSRQEEQLINGKTGRFFVFGNNIKTDKYILMNDEQLVHYPGIDVEGILSPGHTPGSMSYLVNGKYLFTGDVLKLVKGKVEEFHHFINMDTESDRKSIDRLSHLQGVEYIFTAHYGFTSDFSAAFKDWRGSR